MFNDKGIVLKSSICDTIKGYLTIFESSGGDFPVLKFLVKRRDSRGKPKFQVPYKTWMNSRELAAIIQIANRGIALMDEYHEGSLDLKEILLEDEDMVNFENQRFQTPTTDNMFTLPGDEKKKLLSNQPTDKSPDSGNGDVDPNDDPLF